MKYISLFSGIGGFDWGLMLAGHICVGYVEMDKYAHQSFEILHDPQKKLWSGYDVRDITDGHVRELGKQTGGGIQLIAAGFPCQSFSIAGKREGFADATRGTLFFEIIRFASILRPKHLLLENVEGLLNHDKGKTFEIILGTLEELGYVGEWQVHNSSTYVPQNRERIFIVASLGGRSVRKVFPFGRENIQAIDVIGRLEGKGDDYVRRVYGLGGLSPALPTMQGGGQEPKVLVAGHLECDSGGTGKVYDPEGVAPTQLAQHGNAVTKVIIDSKPTQFSVDGDGIAYCLDAGYQKGINDNPNVKARRTMVIQRQFSKQYSINEDVAGTLQASRVDKVPMIVEPRAVLTPDRPEKRQNGRRMKEPGEPMFTLTAQDKHGVVIKKGDVLQRSQSGVHLHEGQYGTLRAGASRTDFGVYDGYRIRKLTPLECFRLQSYPDWWYVTLKLFRHPEYIPLIDMNRDDITHQVLTIILENGLKEGMSDSQLYKMAGNGVTSIVAAEIASRLEEV